MTLVNRINKMLPTRKRPQETDESRNKRIKTNDPDGDDSGHVNVDLDRTPWTDTPLSPEKSHIRIIRLQKGSESSALVCSLEVVSLDEDPFYETLSYVWGDATNTQPISVDGVVFNATVNLVDFLRCLRSTSEDRALWADAICIDQKSVGEKNTQLALMTRIYRQAKNAHIWFGPFTESWKEEISVENKTFKRAIDMSEAAWERINRMVCVNEPDLKDFLAAGGKPGRLKEYIREKDNQSDPELFQEAMRILDEMANTTSKHFKHYPLYLRGGFKNGIRYHEVNKHWLRILDCIQWIYSRPWWNRVWTLQEGVLPRVDSLVHIPPFSMSLSTICQSVRNIIRHRSEKCCKNLGRIFTAEYRSVPYHEWEKATEMAEQRRFFKPSGDEMVPLDHLFKSAQKRNATNPRDNLFGLLGLMHPEWRQYFSEQGYGIEPGELFAQATKLFYSNDNALHWLGEAIGVQQTSIDGLPTWAIDLSDWNRDGDTDTHRWELYDATKGTKFDLNLKWMHQLAGPTLNIQSIHIGEVGATARYLSLEQIKYSPEALRVAVKEMIRVYNLAAPAPESFSPSISTPKTLFPSSDSPPSHPHPYSERFWRAAFMDRDIWRHWLHKRHPLSARRMRDVEEWWNKWDRSKDERDLTSDTQRDDGQPGDYHYRALKMNMEKHRFFMTKKSVPGMGPHTMEVGDEIHMIQGCPAPTVLRRGKKKDSEGVEVEVVVFVGLCFVDLWMYGYVMRTAEPDWKTLEIH
jgi:hypothetical protein